MEYMAEQELELIFLLVVPAKKHCSLHEWRSKFLEPIMSNSESISNLEIMHGKPATLNILRETIMVEN
jgi:hypothetical protein